MRQVFAIIVACLVVTVGRAATTAQLKEAAGAGNTGAMVVLGARYLYGQEGERLDYEQAEQWYRMAADHTVPRAGARQGRPSAP